MEADLFLTETWKETIFRKCGQWQSDLKGRGTPQREEVQELTFYKTDMSQETEEGKRRNKTTWGHESCFSIYITTEEVWLQQTRTAGTDQSGPPNVKCYHFISLQQLFTVISSTDISHICFSNISSISRHWNNIISD